MNGYLNGYLKEEHLEMQKAVRRFTDEKIIPIADKLDQEEAEIPQEILDEMGKLGYFGLLMPVANLVGEENRGFYLLMSGYEVARIQFSARSIGVAQAAFEAALKYSKERVQFDQPIAKFQAIRFKLADMATDIALARQFTYYTAAKRDRGERCDLEAGMVKLFAAEMTLKHTWNAIQIHGGYGYTKEFPVNRYWRDAGLLPIGEGTTEIQREIIARRLLGE